MSTWFLSFDSQGTPKELVSPLPVRSVPGGDVGFVPPCQSRLVLFAKVVVEVEESLVFLDNVHFRESVKGLGLFSPISGKSWRAYDFEVESVANQASKSTIGTGCGL
jgi:hypothetical protein